MPLGNASSAVVLVDGCYRLLFSIPSLPETNAVLSLISCS